MNPQVFISISPFSSAEELNRFKNQIENSKKILISSSCTVQFFVPEKKVITFFVAQMKIKMLI